MDLEFINGQMGKYIKDSGSMDWNKELAVENAKMVIHLLDNLNLDNPKE